MTIKTCSVHTHARKNPGVSRWALVISIASTLAACGSGGSSDGRAPSAQGSQPGSSGQQTHSETAPSGEYLTNENSLIHVSNAWLSETGENKRVATSANAPLDIYPNDKGFQFHWEIDTSAVLFSDNFLYFVRDGQEVSLFSYYVNPIHSTLNSSATCTYNNNNRLTCIRPGSAYAWEAKTVTDMSAYFPQLPATYELRMAVCSLLNGCDHVRLGYVRFN